MKKSDVYTPDGVRHTAEEWMNQYSIVRLETEYLVISGATYNGGFCMVYSDFIDFYEKQGVDFTECVEMQDYLDAVEAWEDAMNSAASSATSAEDRIAAALEAQVMMSMEDVEEV